MRFKRAAVRLSTAAPEASYVAQYGDGASASRIAASVELRPDGLMVKPADAAAVLWPYADLRVAEPVRDRSIDAVLTSRRAERASLYVDDTMMLAQLVRLAPQLQLGHERWRTARPGLAVGATALATYAGIWALDLSPTKGLARTMPESARVVLGESVIRTMPAQKRCSSVDGRAALGKMVTRLMPNGPITAENIIVLDWDMLNAFAVPGNRIVLTRAMLEQARGPDEIAAIIGHEAGHSIELHPEASLVRSVGFWALVQMVFTGTPGAIGNIGVVLAQLGYTRSAEREADGHALRLLREAQISPKPMGDFFRRMDNRAAAPKEAVPVPMSDILSSHPSNPERIARIDAQVAYATTPSLNEADWKALKSICGLVVVPTKPMPAPRPSAPETAAKTPSTETPKSADVVKAEAAIAAAKQEALRADGAKAAAWKAQQNKSAAEKLATDKAAAELAAEKAAQDVAKIAAAKAEAERVAAAQAEAERERSAQTAADAAKIEVEKAAAAIAVAKESAADAAKADTETKAKTQIALATEVPSASAPVPAQRPAISPTVTSIETRIGNASKRIALNAADVAALIDRGQAYAAKPDIAAAIADFSAALALKPTDANTLFWRASMYAQQSQLDQAISDYNDVIRLQPKNFAAFNNRGSLYRSQKKLDLALRDYTSAIAIDAKQAIALTNRALIHRERSNLDAAITDLNAAITANPSYANAYVRRGETLELKSARDAAIADYRAVLRFPEPAAGNSEPHKAARARLTALGAKF